LKNTFTMRYSSGYLRTFLLLFILGMPFSNVAQVPHQPPHGVTKSKAPVKPANKKVKKALTEEEPEKKDTEAKDISTPEDPGNVPVASSPDMSSTELFLLLAALVILPAIPFFFSSKKYSGDSSNRITKFRGWLTENKNALQGAYITGFVVILFTYFLLLKNYTNSNEAIKSYNDSLEKRRIMINKGFKKPKQQRPKADSINRNDTNSNN